MTYTVHSRGNDEMRIQAIWKSCNRNEHNLNPSTRKMNVRCKVCNEHLDYESKVK